MKNNKDKSQDKLKSKDDIVKDYLFQSRKLTYYSHINLFCIIIIAFSAGYLLFFKDLIYSNSLIESISDEDSKIKFIEENISFITIVIVLSKLTFLTLSVFVIQIFYRIFRYNLRVSDHYRSRYNIIHLNETLDWEIDDLFKLFAIDNIDIGSAPKAKDYNFTNTFKQE